MDASAYKLVIGRGRLLAAAAAIWRELLPDARVEAVEIAEDADYTFDLSPLEAVARAGAGGSAFVALGPQFLNFRRFELMAALKERGLRTPPLVEPGARVAADAVVGECAWVGAGAVVGPGARIGYASHVGAGTLIGAGSTIGNSVWIERGVIVGDDCRVGNNSIVGRGVVLDDGVEVGRLCVLDRPARHDRDVPARTFIRQDFDQPLVIVGV